MNEWEIAELRKFESEKDHGKREGLRGTELDPKLEAQGSAQVQLEKNTELLG